MAYKIPDNIKVLCEKENLSDPDEQELVKQELVKFLKYYLDLKGGKNSLANVTDIVSKHGEFTVKGTVYPFERDVAGRMMRTRNYTLKEGINRASKEEVYVIASDRDWWDKFSGWVSVGLLIIGFILGIIGEPIRDQIFPTDTTSSDTVSVKILSMPQQKESENYQKDAQLSVQEKDSVSNEQH